MRSLESFLARVSSITLGLVELMASERETRKKELESNFKFIFYSKRKKLKGTNLFLFRRLPKCGYIRCYKYNKSRKTDSFMYFIRFLACRFRRNASTSALWLMKVKRNKSPDFKEENFSSTLAPSAGYESNKHVWIKLLPSATK